MWLPALLLLAAPASFAAPAPQCPAGAQCAVLTAAQAFDLADRLAGQGRAAEAEAMLEALTRDADVDIRSEARFRIGLLRERRGDWAGAARAYSAILEERPLAGPVRLRLAGALAQQGDDEGARRQLRLAASAGLPDVVARAVSRFQTALRSRRREGGSITFGLAPDSNINRAQGRSTVDVGPLPFELSDDAQAQSGVGVTLGAQAFWRPRLGPRSNLLATAGVSADLYGKGQFNDVALSFSAGPELLPGRARLQLAAVVTRRWFGRSPYSNSYGATFNALQPLGQRTQVQLDLAVVRSDNLVDPDRSGVSVGGAARFERALSPRVFAQVTLRADRQTARDPAFATRSVGGEVLLARETGPLTLYGRAGYMRTWADAAYSFPPARRDDRIVDLEAGAVFRRLSLRGFAPVLRLHRTASLSPVFFYDFQRTRLEFGFTREF